LSKPALTGNRRSLTYFIDLSVITISTTRWRKCKIIDNFDISEHQQAKAPTTNVEIDIENKEKPVEHPTVTNLE
jgi:hypothetical protein